MYTKGKGIIIFKLGHYCVLMYTIIKKINIKKVKDIVHYCILIQMGHSKIREPYKPAPGLKKSQIMLQRFKEITLLFQIKKKSLEVTGYRKQ